MIALDPWSIPSLFGDLPHSPLLHYDRMDVKKTREQIHIEGYAIVKGLVPVALVDSIRAFWTETFTHVKPTGRVTWSPYIGQESHIGFSSDKFQHLFRACDFLWNEPLHAGTRDVCMRTHALRNLVLEQDPFFGIRWGNGRYGIFVTASYYPPGRGYMKLHDDGVTGGVLLHSLVPVTFKGRDYKDGGMVIVDRKGQQVDVDSRLDPGDAVFYDGALKHGVTPIVAKDGKTLGRIQVFPIPTLFDTVGQNIRGLSAIPTARFLNAKWFAIRNKIRAILGFDPTVR